MQTMRPKICYTFFVLYLPKLKRGIAIIHTRQRFWNEKLKSTFPKTSGRQFNKNIQKARKKQEKKRNDAEGMSTNRLKRLILMHQVRLRGSSDESRERARVYMCWSLLRNGVSTLPLILLPNDLTLKRIFLRIQNDATLIQFL